MPLFAEELAHKGHFCARRLPTIGIIFDFDIIAMSAEREKRQNCRLASRGRFYADLPDTYAVFVTDGDALGIEGAERGRYLAGDKTGNQAKSKAVTA